MADATLTSESAAQPVLTGGWLGYGGKARGLGGRRESPSASESEEKFVLESVL